MRSIRRTLLASILGGTALALVAAGLGLNAVMEDAVVSSFDDALLSRGMMLASLLEYDGEYIEFEYSPGNLPTFEAGEDAEYFELWQGEESEGFRSPSLGEVDLPRLVGTVERPETKDLDLPDGRRGRALGLRVRVDGEPGDDAGGDDEDDSVIAGGSSPWVTIVVAGSREPLDALLGRLSLWLLVAGAAALALVGWGAGASVKHGLAPIGRLGDEVERVDATSLARRVDAESIPAELVPLAVKVNELLARLEEAFARQGRITAAMAHELRTPIAELRTARDVAGRWPEDDELRRDLIATAGEVATRMSAAVEAVMHYCHLEAGQVEPEREAIALRAFLEELWCGYEELARERGVRWENEVPDDLACSTDPGLLRLALSNLLHNAASFADPGAVTVRAEAGDGRILLRVSNLAGQLTREDLGRLGEPFWRKDGARTNGAHSGLGLALVSSVSAVMGRAAHYELEGTNFVVSLELERASGLRPSGAPASAASPPRRAGSTPATSPGGSPPRRDASA